MAGAPLSACRPACQVPPRPAPARGCACCGRDAPAPASLSLHPPCAGHRGVPAGQVRGGGAVPAAAHPGAAGQGAAGTARARPVHPAPAGGVLGDAVGWGGGSPTRSGCGPFGGLEDSVGVRCCCCHAMHSLVVHPRKALSTPTPPTHTHTHTPHPTPPPQGCMYKKMDAADRCDQLQSIAFQLDVLEGLVEGPFVAGGPGQRGGAEGSQQGCSAGSGACWEWTTGGAGRACTRRAARRLSRAPAHVVTQRWRAWFVPSTLAAVPTQTGSPPAAMLAVT